MNFKVGEKYKVKKDYDLLRKGVVLILRSRDTDIIEDLVTFEYANANTEIEVKIRYDTAIDILEPLDPLESIDDKEIDLINKIIYEAVIHGGDYGGPYYVNFKDLKESVDDWLKFKNLIDKYVFIADQYGSNARIVKRN